MKIVLKPALFTRLTSVYVINNEDNSIAKNFAIAMEELPVRIPELCREYQVDKITIAGSKMFNKKIGQMIQSNAISQYDLKIEIEYA